MTRRESQSFCAEVTKLTLVENCVRLISHQAAISPIRPWAVRGPLAPARAEAEMLIAVAAAETLDLAQLREYLSRGAPLDQTDSLGRTALWFAARQGHVKALAMLHEAGASVTQCAEDGASPLHAASILPSSDVAKSLLDAKANVNAATYDGATSLFLACQAGRAETTRLLLEAGADVNGATDNGDTPLFAVSA